MPAQHVRLEDLTADLLARPGLRLWIEDGAGGAALVRRAPLLAPFSGRDAEAQITPVTGVVVQVERVDEEAFRTVQARVEALGVRGGFLAFDGRRLD